MVVTARGGGAEGVDFEATGGTVEFADSRFDSKGTVGLHVCPAPNRADRPLTEAEEVDIEAPRDGSDTPSADIWPRRRLRPTPCPFPTTLAGTSALLGAGNKDVLLRRSTRGCTEESPAGGSTALFSNVTVRVTARGRVGAVVPPATGCTP